MAVIFVKRTIAFSHYQISTDLIIMFVSKHSCCILANTYCIHVRVYLQFTRHILAIIHFNCNLQRLPKMNIDGTAQVNVVYPKFKNGKGTLGDVRVKPIFGKTNTASETNLILIMFCYNKPIVQVTFMYTIACDAYFRLCG